MKIAAQVQIEIEDSVVTTVDLQFQTTNVAEENMAGEVHCLTRRNALQVMSAVGMAATIAPETLAGEKKSLARSLWETAKDAKTRKEFIAALSDEELYGLVVEWEDLWYPAKDNNLFVRGTENVPQYGPFQATEYQPRIATFKLVLKPGEEVKLPIPPSVLGQIARGPIQPIANVSSARGQWPMVKGELVYERPPKLMPHLDDVRAVYLVLKAPEDLVADRSGKTPNAGFRMPVLSPVKWDTGTLDSKQHTEAALQQAGFPAESKLLELYQEYNDPKTRSKKYVSTASGVRVMNWAQAHTPQDVVNGLYKASYSDTTKADHLLVYNMRHRRWEYAVMAGRRDGSNSSQGYAYVDHENPKFSQLGSLPADCIAVRAYDNYQHPYATVQISRYDDTPPAFRVLQDLYIEHSERRRPKKE